MSFTLEAIRDWLDVHFEESVARLGDFLRIPSVGTDPAHDADTRRAAEWLARELAALDLEVTLEATGGHPVVLARGGAADGPRLLYYGHYDVQPPDPLDEWRSPPFEPTIGDGPHGRRIVARGAVDNKGQLMTIIEALRAVRAVAGGIPIGVTLMIEGEEESGSPHLGDFLRTRRARLEARAAVISDTTMISPDRPAITDRLRGLLYLELALQGPGRDLHSGLYGGVAPNPLHGLARLVASLHDPGGRIAVSGFYDGVFEPEEEVRRSWRELGFDEAAFLAAAGLEKASGEEGFSLLERLWARPCLDVNGMWGGYTGDGQKTVIPSQAWAKLSARLVPDQDPEAVLARLETHLRAHCPADLQLSLRRLAAAAPVRVPGDSPHLAAAERALSRVFPHPPVRIGCGGTIPVVALLRDVLGLDSLLLGFGLDDDGAHSPNEKFELICFRRGIESHAALIAECAGG